MKKRLLPVLSKHMGKREFPKFKTRLFLSSDPDFFSICEIPAISLKVNKIYNFVFFC